MGSWPSAKVRLGTLNSSDITRWYLVPSTRDLVVRRCLGVSSSIQPAFTTLAVVARRMIEFFMILFLLLLLSLLVLVVMEQKGCCVVENQICY